LLQYISVKYLYFIILIKIQKIEEEKMEYINNKGVTPLALGVLKRPLHKTKSHNNNYRNKGQSRPRQNIGSNHQLWEPYTNVALLTLSHQ